MSFKKNIISISYLLLSLQIIISILGTNNYTVSIPYLKYYFDIIVFLALISFIITFFSRTIKVKELVFIVLWLVISIITFITTKDVLVIANALMIISARRFSLKQMVQTVFFANLFSLATTLLLFILGFVSDNTNGTLNKHSFGLSHPNQLGAVLMVLILCSAYWFVHGSKNIKFILVILNVPFLLLLNSSGSRGGLLASLLMFFILMLYYFKANVLYRIGLFVGIFFFCFSLYSTSTSVYTNGSILNKLDTLMTNRVRMNNVFMTNYGIKLFGQQITYTGGSSLMYYADYAYLDNGYLRNLINFGVAYSLIFYIFILSIMRKVNQLHLYSVYIIIIPMLTYGFVEEGFTSFLTNIVLLLTSVLFVSKEKERD
ncbi:hypothetical protein [Weissella soli]|uniref:hypothetical protein n=1 Tax=Weissella soli TaxID=155866 RepID=UPI0011BB331E|nr:hypothetical protein [Weissella soli]QEA35201.1 hypothetical protein FGL88_05305 [Weissella soli]